MSSTRWLVWAGVAAGAAGVVLALAGVRTPLRAPLVLLFLALAPAVAVAGSLRHLDTLARIVVAGTASVVINFLVAELMLATGTWSPRAGLAVVVAITVVFMAAALPPVRVALRRRLTPWRAAIQRLTPPGPPAGVFAAPPGEAPASQAADDPPAQVPTATSAPEPEPTDTGAPAQAEDEDVDDPTD